MGLFGRGYERDFDQNYRSSNLNQGRGYWDGPESFYRTRYGTDYRYRGQDRPMGRWGYPDTGSIYDVEYRGSGYDRNYRNRYQTDFGDPFGDREQHTPIRMIRHEPRGYDSGYFGSGRGRRDTYPFGYVPYAQRVGYDTGYRQRTSPGFGRGYGGDWF
jgi:hypothetical protein